MGDEPAEPSPTAVTTAATASTTGTTSIETTSIETTSIESTGTTSIGATGTSVTGGAGVDLGVGAGDLGSEAPGPLDPLGEDAGLLPCSWCGASDLEVVPLVAGRASRRRIVAAICPRCLDAEPGAGALSPLLVVAFGALALASLWVSSMPGRPPSRATTAIAIGWVVVVAAYGFQAIRAALAARRGASGALRSWRWAVPPLLGLFVAVAVLLALPLRGRFALSRAAIASAADDASPGVGHHGRLVAYPGGLVDRVDGSTGVLVDARCGFFRTEPSGAAAAAGRPETTDATGNATGDGTGSGTAGGGHVLVDTVDLGGGWQAGCLVAPVDPSAVAPTSVDATAVAPLCRRHRRRAHLCRRHRRCAHPCRRHRIGRLSAARPRPAGRGHRTADRRPAYGGSRRR